MKPMVPLYLGLAFVVLIFNAFAPVSSPDLYWHLRIGSDFVFRGLNPFYDHYSFTFEGTRQHMLTLPFDMLAAVMFKCLGYFGIGVMRFLIWSLGLFLLNHLLVREKVSDLVRLFSISLFVYSVAARPEPRPELLSVPLEMITLIYLPRWRKSQSWWGTVWFSLLLLIWTNMHTSSAFGYIILGAFILEMMYFAVRDRDWRSLIFAVGSGFLFLAVGFINPDWSHPLLLPFKFDPRWKLYIDEFVPKDFVDLDTAFRVFFALAAIALPGLFIMRKYGAFILVLILAIENLRVEKILLHAIPIAAPFIAISFDFYLQKFSALSEKRAVGVVKLIVAILSLGILWRAYSVLAVPFSMLQAQQMSDYYPSDVVAYMKNHNMKGRIMADYGYGGYVLFEMYPDMQVYIDGRTNMVYSYNFFDRFMKAFASPQGIFDEAKRYNIDYLLVSFRSVTTAEAARLSTVFTLDYVGRDVSLYVRKGGHFKHMMGLIYHPECISSTPDPHLKDEEKIVLDIEITSALRPFMALMEMYQLTKDKASLFAEYHWDWATNPVLSREAATFAKREKKWKAVLYYIGEIPDPYKTAGDRLDRAEAFCQLEHCERAEYDLDQVADQRLTDDQWYRVATLMKEARAKGPFQFLKASKYEDVQNFAQNYIKKHGGPPATRNYCEAKQTSDAK